MIKKYNMDNWITVMQGEMWIEILLKNFYSPSLLCIRKRATCFVDVLQQFMINLDMLDKITAKLFTTAIW